MRSSRAVRRSPRRSGRTGKKPLQWREPLVLKGVTSPRTPAAPSPRGRRRVPLQPRWHRLDGAPARSGTPRDRRRRRASGRWLAAPRADRPAHTRTPANRRDPTAAGLPSVANLDPSVLRMPTCSCGCANTRRRTGVQAGQRRDRLDRGQRGDDLPTQIRRIVAIFVGAHRATGAASAGGPPATRCISSTCRSPRRACPGSAAARPPPSGSRPQVRVGHHVKTPIRYVRYRAWETRA